MIDPLIGKTKLYLKLGCHLYTSKDISVAVFVSVLGLVYAVVIGQIPFMISGILGANYVAHIGYAILVSFGLLMYEGRRWRFLLQGFLVTFLFIPIASAGYAFDILSRVPTLYTAFFVDLIFNSLYGFFYKQNRIKYWGIISTVASCLIHIFFRLLNYYLFYSSETVTAFISITLILLPVIIIENVFGALIGFKIYQRTQNIFSSKS